MSAPNPMLFPRPGRLLSGALTRWLLAATLALVCTQLHANYLDDPQAQAMIDKLVQKGLDRDHLQALFKQAERNEDILEAISSPAEETLTWGEYRGIFIEPSRIQKGVEFWHKHQELLLRAETQFGVSRYIIMAILGVETYYGKYKGDYKVLDALATLAFDYPPRSDFFAKQLRILLLFQEEAGIDVTRLKGSYAGAIGYPQFIPSSYRAYAVDFDHDGQIDLVHSLADAVGSIANYLAEHGWREGLPVAAHALVNGDDYLEVFGKKMKPAYTLGELQQWGITALSCHSEEFSSPHCFDLPPNTRVTPLHLHGQYGSEFWLGTMNFYVITRYNHSPLYAMAVYQLATKLKLRIEDDPVVENESA